MLMYVSGRQIFIITKLSFDEKRSSASKNLAQSGRSAAISRLVGRLRFNIRADICATPPPPNVRCQQGNKRTRILRIGVA